MHQPAILKARREAMRWHLLDLANLSRPEGINVTAMLPVIQSVYHDATLQEVRRELDYLDTREMIVIKKDPLDNWFVELTRTGIDFAEYTIDAQPGIARPRITQG